MKAIHYINQFFGQVGGEEAADAKPVFHNDLVGCSNMLNQIMPNIEVTHTIVCGDNYVTNHTDEALAEILGWLEKQEFDIFFAGPAFMAGRYGVGCGLVCKAVAEKFNVPVITSMNEENPGVEEFKGDAYIFEGGRKATFMKDDMTKMAAFAEKIAKGEKLATAPEEGYFIRGIRYEMPHPEGVMASDRVVDMLIKKLNGEPFVSELIIPKMDKIAPAAALKDLSKATIAIVSSSGVVPVENPDRIQSASATKWGKYDISKLDNLPEGVFKTIHAGFDPAAMCAVPDRGVPVDAMKFWEKEGKFGKLHDYFYVTVGTGTTQAYAAKFGKEIAAELKAAGVDAVLLTSTWGTCTRCGTTMGKEIERTGIPVVAMINLIDVAKTVGSNRMVQTVSVPYPLGDPELSPEDDWALRKHRVEVALDSLATDVEEATVFKTKL